MDKFVVNNFSTLKLKAAYQRQLLAQIGITPWVGSTTPVQRCDIAEMLEQSENFSESKRTFQSLTTQFSENVSNATTNINISARPALEDDRQRDILPQAPVIVPNLTQQICRYHIQAMVLPRWLFICDNAVLQQDNRQLELWQKIGKSTQAAFYELQYPLINTPQHRQLLSGYKNDPNAMPDLFASETSGMTTFSGFIHSLLGENRQIGYLTPLPELLLNHSMQALPMLAEMIENPQQKRVLWQLIQSADN